MDEDRMRNIAFDVVKEKMEEICLLKHDKIVSDVSVCLSEKFTDLYKKLFWSGVVVVVVLVISQIIIKTVFHSA